MNTRMTETPRKNPFRPGVGTRPTYLAGRERELKRFGSTLRAAPEIPANVRLTGLRGVGKTVLLSEFERVGQESGWATALLELEPRHNNEEGITQAITALCRRSVERMSTTARLRAKVGKAIETLSSIGVTYQDITLSFEAGTDEREKDLARALFEAVEAAVEHGYLGFIVLLDEAQVLRDETNRKGDHPLSLLISAISALQKKELPISVVLCGLPTLTGHLLSARTYSERMFRGEEIGSLDPGATKDAFVEPLKQVSVGVTDDLVDAVLDSVEGYPYFIQLWGAELWDAAEDVGITDWSLDLLSVVEPDIYRRLDTDFYDPRVETLRPAEQDLLLAAATAPYPPLHVAEIHSQTDKSPKNVNVLLGRLVEMGIIYRLRKGQYEYTAPKFHDYLGRRLARTEP